jgi:Flp pilus assembly protein TadD
MIYLGRTYLIRSEPQRAVELNRRMVDLYPAFPLAHWLLGLSLMAEKQDDLAREEVRKALEMGYKFQNNAEGDAVRPLLGADLFNRLVKPR